MHFFEEQAAKRYGVVPAVILQNIYYWCEKNRANGMHFHDGNYWTYNSEKAFSELFGYLTKWQIRTEIKKLEDEGAILKGNYNASPYDRTLWYAVTAEALEILRHGDGSFTTPILQKCNLGVGQNQNENCRIATPIPNNKPDRNSTDRNTDGNTSVAADVTAPATRPQKEPKQPFGEYGNVRLTQREYERLIADYGATETADAITFLDEYIEEKGYKSKSHNLAMRRWVYSAVAEKRPKKKAEGGKIPGGDYDWANL